jgi:hypothetical protein
MNNWLDKYEQGGMVLKQKTKDNYGKKANPNNPDVSLPPEFKGLAYNTKGRDYSPAWGGQFENGGYIAQKGVAVPTSADSARLFNSQMALNNFYAKEVKAGRLKKGPKSDYTISDLSYNFSPSSLKRLNEENLRFYREKIKERNTFRGRGIYDENYAEYFNLSPEKVRELENKGLGQTKAGSEYQQYYRDIITPMQNLASPFALVDSRIKPQRLISYGPVIDSSKNIYPGGSVSVFDYDPLAIKPYHMRTDKEKIEWEKKYGKKTTTEKSKTEPEKKKTPVTKKSEETKPAPYTPTGSKKYIVDGIEVNEEDFLGTGSTTGGSKRIIYSTPKLKDRKVLRLDGTPETDQEKIRKAMRAQEKDDEFQNGGNLWNTNKTAWVDSIHNARKGDLNFVQRMFDQRAGSIQIPGQPGTSTHYMESGDGKAYPTVVQMPNGKLQYLNQNDKDAAWNYANKTGQFIKFPNDEQAEWYANNGYKKGTNVLKKAMGGSIPGAIGFTYARTVGAAPSNGPYAKKTKASAQNGMEMKYYQEGLDFKPKTISKNGGWLDKFDTAQDGKFMSNLISKEENKNRGDIASYFPQIQRMKDEPKIKEVIVKADQKRQKQILAEAVAIGNKNRTTVKQDNRTSREKKIAEQELLNLKRDEALRNSPLAQTIGSFTPSGYNPGAGAIGAEAFVNMNPLITGPFLSGTRLYGQAKGDNPYGFGESTFGNIMGAVALVGDAAFLKGAAPTGRVAGKNAFKNFVDQQSSGKLSSSSPEPNLKVLPRGNYLESELVAGKEITMNDVDKIAKKEVDWLQSDEYFKRRSAATGESAAEIQRDVDKIFENWKNISVEAGKTKKNVGGYYNRSNNKIVIGKTLGSRELGLSVLDHEVKHAFSQLGGLSYRGGYKNYPTTKVGNWLTKALDYTDTQYHAEPWEQQVRGLRLLDYMNETYNIPRGTTLTMENIDQLAKDISSSTMTESGKGFWNKYYDVGDQIIRMQDADKQLKFIPSNIKQGKFPFKFQQKGNLRENILNWLNRTYAVPVGIGLGAGALGSDEEVPQKQDGGDIPVDPDGYWNPENWGNPVIIPSTDITMEGVDQPLIGISDTGDTQYMEPGEDYEFDGEYVTEYPVAKKGISVNNADAQPIKKLDQSLNFTNYNKPTKGGWLDKYN